MAEYIFQVSGRHDLIVPTGTREAGMFCSSPRQIDNRVQDIEGLAHKFGADITRIVRVMPVVGSKEELDKLDFDIAINPEYVTSFADKLSLKDYKVLSQREMTEEDIKKREDRKKEFIRAMELATGYNERYGRHC